MSGIVRPKGGAPPSIYWRRRLILVAVVLLLTAGGFKLFGGGGDDDDPQADTKQSSAEADENDRADEPDKSDARKKKRRKNRNRDNVSAGQKNVPVNLRENGTCDPTAVTVTPSLATESYSGGAATVRLAFATTSDTACTLSLSKHQPLISISDDSKLVWESQRCTDLLDTDQVRLQPGWLTYVNAAWSGRASGHTCGERADFAKPGSYKLQAAMLGGEPSTATVDLEKDPKPAKQDKKNGQNKKDDKNNENKKQNDANDTENDKQNGNDKPAD